MTHYTVQSGDTLVRIAKQFGFADWRTIYRAPENEAFRRKRPDPDRIFPGDDLIIPDRDPAPGGFETGRRHRFRLARTRETRIATLTVRVFDDAAKRIDRADVRLVDTGGLEVGSAQTADGVVTFTSLAPGSYTVSARKRGYLEERSDVVVTSSDEITLTLELTWRADWDRAEGAAMMGSVRRMVLTAPGLPAGSPVTFTVAQLGVGTIGKVDVSSDADRAEAAWDDWFAPERVGTPVQLAAGQPFPVVRFRFVAEASDLQMAAEDALAYADRLDARIDAAQVIEPAQSADYVLYSPYGTRTGTTDANGALQEAELPPGGVSVVFVQQVLVPG